jgi:hypothetical protein
LLGLLQYQRDSFVRKVTDIDDATARAALVPSGTTLLWLTRHLARAERTWVIDRFAAAANVSPDDSLSGDDTIDAAIDAYRGTWAEVDEVIAGASFDALCARPGELGDANLRWVVMHLLEETARHAGHADIIRELIDGTTGR